MSTTSTIGVLLLLLFSLYTMSQKKTSHFNFWHNFAICWDIFTIFEAPCSGLIAGWCNLLHTHHRCEAFTWRDVTHDVIQAVARSAHWHRISYHLTILSAASCKRRCTGHTYLANIDELKYRIVQVWAELDHRHIAVQLSDSGDTVSKRVTRVWKLGGGYFDQRLHWIYM